ncbi:MAG: hypothetical protein ACM31N_10385 [Deltaproteobacteria bacterium]
MALVQEFQVGAKLLHLLLAFCEGFLDGLRLAPLADVLDEVVEHLSLFSIFDFLPFGRPR